MTLEPLRSCLSLNSLILSRPKGKSDTLIILLPPESHPLRPLSLIVALLAIAFASCHARPNFQVPVYFSDSGFPRSPKSFPRRTAPHVAHRSHLAEEVSLSSGHLRSEESRSVRLGRTRLVPVFAFDRSSPGHRPTSLRVYPTHPATTSAPPDTLRLRLCLLQDPLAREATRSGGDTVWDRRGFPGARTLCVERLPSTPYPLLNLWIGFGSIARDRKIPEIRTNSGDYSDPSS